MTDKALVIDHVTKHFGGVKALTDIHLEFNKAEIIGLIGSNGAGKSTLLNIIWGVFPPDSGQLYINGEKIKKITPEKAHELGISIIFQHRRLMPHMTIAENIFIERMPKKNGIIDYKKMHADTRDLLSMLDLDIDSKKLVSELSAEEKQLVEIVKACSRKPKILLMDEPTTALRQNEVDTLFRIMRNLKDNGCSVVFISHRLKEVMDVCDRISIIRDGRNVIEGPKSDFTADLIVDYMSGKLSPGQDTSQPSTSASNNIDLLTGQNLEAKHFDDQTPLLNVTSLNINHVKDVNFKLHKGEILGFAGLGGSGIDDIYDSLFGLQKSLSGSIEIDGTVQKIKNPRTAIKHGLGLVPEDRQLSGEFLELSVADNICIPKGQKRSIFSLLNRKSEKKAAEHYVKELGIKTDSVVTPIKNLSGGNQQKAIIAKWLEIDSRIILMSEPTAGIDVAAKNEVNKFIKKIANEGKGIVYTSSYITELMDVSDRLIVIYQGKIFKEFKRGEYDHNKVYLAINGIEE